MIGLDRARGRIISIRAVLPRAAKSACRAALERTWQSARGTVPVDTGRLRDSLTITQSSLSGTVSTVCPYARAVESETPFLAPAAKRGDFTNECAKALREALHD